MKREIDGRVYDTTLAMLVASQEKSSTHIHRATSLYRSADGDFFVVEEREAHGVDSVMLTPMSQEMAREWLEEHGKADVALSQFGDEKVSVTLELDSSLKQRIAADARARKVSEEGWMIAALEAALTVAKGTRAHSKQTTQASFGKETA